jgi:hypothetical protein
MDCPAVLVQILQRLHYSLLHDLPGPVLRHLSQPLLLIQCPNDLLILR